MTDKANALMARDYKGLANQEHTAVAIPVLTPDRAEKRQNGRRFKENGEPAFTLTAQDKHGVAIGIRETEDGFHQYRNDEKQSSIQGTHVTYPEGKVHCMGTFHVPMTCEKVEPIGGLYTNVSEEYQHGVLEGVARGLKTEKHDSGVALGVIDPQGRIGKEVEPSDTCSTLRAQSHGNEPEVVIATDTEESEHDGIYVQLSEDVTVYAIWYEKYQCYIAIRKLTPKECFRLQGWEDNYFERAQFVNSDSQLYRQAGNGVTVNVIYEMAKKMEVQNERT